MARLTSANGLKESGWVFLVGAEKDDLSDFDEIELEAMRKSAVVNMPRALALYVSEVKSTLGRVLLAPTRAFAWLSGRHFAAAPGDPPAKRSGDLIRSWRVGKTRWSQNRTVYTGYIESDHPAAGRLEFGDHPPAIEVEEGVNAHPYIRPTLQRIGDRLHNLLLGLE